MVLFRSAAVLVAAVTGCLARTPAGFEPASTSEARRDLIVDFSGIVGLNRAVLFKEANATQPRLGTRTQLIGTLYAVIMIDLDIPSNTSKTNTLLHWMQPGLTPATTATRLNTTGTTGGSDAAGTGLAPKSTSTFVTAAGNVALPSGEIMLLLLAAGAVLLNV